MLVKDCMTRHPIMISPATAAADAQKIMTESKVRHLPVTGKGKRLKGLITRQSFSLAPDVLASLDVWHITRYLSGLTVKELMVKADKVHTIAPDKTVERAAQIMSDHKIGCLPVIEDDVVVGIITEIDVMQAIQMMLAMRAEGVRVTVRMPDRPGEFAKISAALGENKMGVMGIGTYPSPRREGSYDVVLKIPGVTTAAVREVLGQIPDQEIVDIRDVV
jgi:acetoin utilization protein AcuB